MTFLLGKVRPRDLPRVTQLVKNEAELWPPGSADPQPVLSYVETLVLNRSKPWV